MSGIVSVLKGYKWLAREIREAISDALAHHEAREGDWQKAVEERLGRLEAKVDSLLEGHPRTR